MSRRRIVWIWSGCRDSKHYGADAVQPFPVSKFETLWCCRHQAGGKQYATGILHLFFRIFPLQKKKAQTANICNPAFLSVEIRNTIVLPPSSWRQSTVHRTVEFSHSNLDTKEKSRKSKCSFCFFGPSVEIRTRGLLNPIQARYQTSPHPEIAVFLTTSI